MNNILAAQVLKKHLPDIGDGEYKEATKIAIETLYMDAIIDWHKSNSKLSAMSYLEMSQEEYEYWILGTNRE